MCAAPQSHSRAPGLYVVATPIGNLGDLSPRARELLETVDTIAAEDTRTARKLLGTGTPFGRIVSLTEHNVEQRIPSLLKAAQNGTVALVSEAGTPGIADPGVRLVIAAHKASVRVFSIPGPSALTSALAASGFDAPGTLFLGFLPRKRGERMRALGTARGCAANVVFFESPGRLAGALADVATALNDPETVVCREISKLHEEITYGRASELAGRFENTRGECTVVVRLPTAAPSDFESGLELLAAMKRAGAQRSSSAAEVARITGTSREELYRAWEQL